MDFKKRPAPWKHILEEVKEEIHSLPRKKVSIADLNFVPCIRQ